MTRKTESISTDEQQLRRDVVTQAFAHNRIEGITPDPAAQPIFDAFINGEIDIFELGRRIDALPIAEHQDFDRHGLRHRVGRQCRCPA